MVPRTYLLSPTRSRAFLAAADEISRSLCREGTSVTKTLDWFTLNFVPSIDVPRDAWIDWDAVGERFITAGELHPKGLKARTKTVVRYADNLWETRWHDGNKLSWRISYLLSSLASTGPTRKAQFSTRPRCRL